MKEIVVDAKIENLDEVLQFIEGELEANDCPMKVQMQIAIAVEELFVNIAHYAYNPKDGEATIRIMASGEPVQVSIQFLDNGKPYNPLGKEDPDITLSAEERQIGGLGIYMVKKTMDAIEYEYNDGQNILTIRKTL